MKCLFKMLSIIIIMLSTFTLFISPSTYANEDENWTKIKNRGELRVGLSADYAPLEFEKTIHGKTEYAGVDIELAKKIAKDIKTSKILKAKKLLRKKGQIKKKLHKLRLKIVKFLHSIDYLKLYYL